MLTDLTTHFATGWWTGLIAGLILVGLGYAVLCLSKILPVLVIAAAMVSPRLLEQVVRRHSLRPKTPAMTRDDNDDRDSTGAGMAAPGSRRRSGDLRDHPVEGRLSREEALEFPT